MASGLRPYAMRTPKFAFSSCDPSGSIAVYRPQAEYFGGRSDGKFGVPSVKVALFQVLKSAEDN
jgi:hypothetical protein